MAVRLGLRYVRNLGEKDIDRIEAARQIGGKFVDPQDLAFRTGLSVPALEGLAASGALEMLGIERRAGIWAAGALAEIDPERLPLSPGTQAPPLPGMSAEEEHRADLWSTGVSNTHPIQFIRAQLSNLGCMSVMEALSQKRNGVMAAVGGVVTHRQHPGTAAGVIFFNLEDETGMLNVVVLPPVWTANREVARKSAAMVIGGRLEYRDGVTNLIAHRFTPLNVMTVRSRDFR
jgi:error-prone DNA polymerase